MPFIRQIIKIMSGHKFFCGNHVVTSAVFIVPKNKGHIMRTN